MQAVHLLGGGSEAGVEVSRLRAGRPRISGDSEQVRCRGLCSDLFAFCPRLQNAQPA